MLAGQPVAPPGYRFRTALDVTGGARAINYNDARTIRPAFGATLVVLYGM